MAQLFFKKNKPKLFVLFFFIFIALFCLHFLQASKLIASLEASLFNNLKTPIKIINNSSSYFYSKIQLNEKIAALRQQNQILQTKIYRLSALQKQNNQLRQLLSSSSNVGGDFIVAQLLAILKNTSVFEIIINKGKSDSLYLGQPVLDGFGVFGQVIKIYSDVAKVQLILDRKSAIPVQSKQGVRGIVKGVGKLDYLTMIDVSNPEMLKVGDVLLTSGLGLKFSAGYPVGMINDISKNKDSSWQIKVKPTAHLFNSSQFLLIWPEQSRWSERVKDLVKAAAK